MLVLQYPSNSCLILLENFVGLKMASGMSVALLRRFATSVKCAAQITGPSATAGGHGGIVITFIVM